MRKAPPKKVEMEVSRTELRSAVPAAEVKTYSRIRFIFRFCEPMSIDFCLVVFELKTMYFFRAS